ncbi:MAG: tetratricopeptide repeat protein [Ferruginibacter sp.]|nr:tetratricopeptide repeat protein [Cytophagales bacterium]
MKKSMVVALVSAGALTGALYRLPKVIVDDEAKQSRGITLNQSVPDSAIGSADHPVVPLSAEQAAIVDRLRTAYLTSADKEKKGRFADSLAVAFARLGKPDSAARYWEVVATLEPTEANLLQTANGYYDAFGFAADAGRATQLGEKARGYYQKVLAIRPDFLEAKAKMAMTYVTSDNPMQGIALLREVIAEDPDYELALFNLGLLSIRSGQYDKAIERFERIIELNPDNGQAQFYLGVSYAETGRKQEAKRLFTLVKQRETDPAILASATEYLQKLD